ncbi:malate dehydrogenase [archaeon]|nr:MAG: malate dehydrogenase [archaeon]
MKTLNVVITGGAGRIAYSLIPLILNGLVFGLETRIILRLLDIPIATERLHGVVMEVEDSGYDLLDKIVATTDPDEAFVDAEVVVMLGGIPRLAGMERKDLLIQNAECIQNQARSLNKFGNAHTKVLVVANPANTNALVAIKSAPNIPPENFTCLTRLDQERLRHFCAHRVSAHSHTHVRNRDVHDVYIWGNHSTTQVAHIDEGVYVDSEGVRHRVSETLSHGEYEGILRKVQHRGGEIIKALGVSIRVNAACICILQFIFDLCAMMYLLCIIL